MKWIHIRDNIYKCPKCGAKFSINLQKPWKCCPICEQKISGISTHLQTNEEVIRNMSTEELADYLFDRGNCQEYCYGICAYQDECEGLHVHDNNFCKKQIVKWLKSPINLTH